MSERLKKTYDIPSAEEIAEYLESLKNREAFNGGDEIREKVEGVRLVTEDGKFLGWGIIGRYDWFKLTIDPRGKNVSRNLHHENSSKKFKMTSLREDFYIMTDEMRNMIDKLTS